MTIASAIQNAQNKVANAYTAISNKGGTLPATQDLSNMPNAINTISTGGTINSLNVTPTTSAQTITASGGVDGYNPVNVSAVTASIDANITAGNIKSGVSILGVTGSYEGESGIGVNREITANGVYQIPQTSFIFSLPSNATSLADYALAYAFYYGTGITSVDLSKIVSVGAMSLNYTFYKNIYITSANLEKLKEINGNSAMQNCFQGCSSLESINLNSLESVNGSNALSGAFRGTKLSTLSFYSLKSSGVGQNIYWSNMLRDVTGCIVHFPSNLQSVIGSWSNVTAGFGGTNTTVLFDLPATT